MADIKELEEIHGALDQIPNESLYNYLVDNYKDLVNEARLGVARIPESRLGKEVRRRCTSDLMWLARHFTWMTNPASENGSIPFTENIFDEEFYGPFPQLFVKKDASLPLNKQSDYKTRMLLWPRGGAKSTFDHVDTVQWILNFPSIRICYLTATVDLAEGFVGEIKGHFYFKEEPTFMNLFFPEFCIEEGNSGPVDRFICPVYAKMKTGRKEPTVIASSVGKAKAGWRYELIKADDAVSDVNSETLAGCEKISKALFLAEKLLALGGFYIDFIGTRYADEDHYGVVFEQNKIGDVCRTEGTGWELIENKTTMTKILVGRAMTIKPEIVQKLESEGKQVSYQEAGPNGVILLLPNKMDYAWCMADFTKDEKSFEGQRNQNPRPRSHIQFDRPLLLRSTVPAHEMPPMGVVTQVWDFAFSKKKGRDYSTGCSIIWAFKDEYDPQGKKIGQKVVGYVQEIVRDRFNHITLAQAVVGLAQRHRPAILGIENAGGSEFLTEQIKAEAVRTRDARLLQTCSSIDWFAPDNQKDAKQVRMASLFPLLVEGRLKFFNACLQPNLEKLYTEFEACLGNARHDDIPDVISMELRYQPKVTLAIVENNEEMMTRTADTQWWNLTFEDGADQFGRLGFGGFAPPPQPPSELEEDLMVAEEDPMQYFSFPR